AAAALVFVPRLLTRGAGVLGRRAAPVVNFLLLPFDRGYAWLQRVYPGMLRAALARPGRVLGISAGAFALSLAAAAFLPVNLFPTSSQGQFDFDLRLPEGTSVEVTASALVELTRASNAVPQPLARVPGLEDVQTSARGGEPEVRIQFDRDRLAAMHLEPDQASRLVRNAVQGEAATQFSDLDRKLD